MGRAGKVAMIRARTASIALAGAFFLLAWNVGAQGSGREGWIEERGGKTLPDDPGHAYFDPASVHHGDDGLVYFNEVSGVTRPDEVGRTGFMKNAYDCAKNL